MVDHHEVFFDVKAFNDRSGSETALSLPSACTYSFLSPDIGRYYGFPNFRTLFFRNDRNNCIELARRQFLHISRNKCSWVRSKARALKIYISIGIAMSHISNELKKIRPSLIVCFNRETPINTLIRMAAEKCCIPILFVEGGILPGTIEFDSVGNEALSWPIRCQTQFKQIPIDEKDKFKATRFLSFMRKNRVSRKTQQSAGMDSAFFRKDHGRPVVFFVGSNEQGSGIYFDRYKRTREYSPFFLGNQDALNHLLTLAEQQDWWIVFKPHPNETDDRILYRSNSPRLHVFEQASIFDLIDLSDVTITITSGVSGVSLIHGKPSILLGRNGLHGMGATYDLDNKENLGILIEKAINEGFTENMQKSWLEYVSRIIKFYSFSFGPDIESHIGRGVEDAAQLLLDYLEEGNRDNMNI